MKHKTRAIGSFASMSVRAESRAKLPLLRAKRDLEVVRALSEDLDADLSGPVIVRIFLSFPTEAAVNAASESFSPENSPALLGLLPTPHFATVSVMKPGDEVPRPEYEERPRHVIVGSTEGSAGPGGVFSLPSLLISTRMVLTTDSVRELRALMESWVKECGGTYDGFEASAPERPWAPPQPATETSAPLFAATRRARCSTRFDHLVPAGQDAFCVRCPLTDPPMLAHLVAQHCEEVVETFASRSKSENDYTLESVARALRTLCTRSQEGRATVQECKDGADDIGIWWVHEFLAGRGDQHIVDGPGDAVQMRRHAALTERWREAERDARGVRRRAGSGRR